MIKIYVRVLDNNPVFATNLIKITSTFNPEDLPFQIENNEIAIYTQDELNSITNLLNDKSINFTIEEIIWDNKIKDKVKDHKYNSRTELIKHIQDEIEEPEQNKLPRLIKENKELKQKLEETEDILVDVMLGRKNQKFIDKKFQEGKITAQERNLLMK